MAPRSTNGEQAEQLVQMQEHLMSRSLFRYRDFREPDALILVKRIRVLFAPARCGPGRKGERARDLVVSARSMTAIVDRLDPHGPKCRWYGLCSLS
jgi:hypothetical protein